MSSEFASRGENEDTGSCFDFVAVEETLESREKKGGCLATARDGTRAQVAPHERLVKG